MRTSDHQAEASPGRDGSADPVAAGLETRARFLAEHAGVEVRSLRVDEMAAASHLFEEVWHTDGRQSPMETSLLVALGHTGHYVSGAFAGGELVGGCVGFHAEPLGEVLHSHAAGVRWSSAGRGVGAALKAHQRWWCRRRGLRTIAWTYDPLVARNAWLNLERLGARVVEHLVDFYGEMGDGLNVGQGSDRLLVHWAVDPEAVPAAHPVPGPVVVRLSVGPDDQPVIGVEPVDPGRGVSVGVPGDVEGLRERDPALGVAWRHAVRDTLVPLLADGWAVTGFDRSGRYTLLHPQTRPADGAPG